MARLVLTSGFCHKLHREQHIQGRQRAGHGALQRELYHVSVLPALV